VSHLASLPLATLSSHAPTYGPCAFSRHLAGAPVLNLWARVRVHCRDVCQPCCGKDVGWRNCKLSNPRRKLFPLWCSPGCFQRVSGLAHTNARSLPRRSIQRKPEPAPHVLGRVEEVWTYENEALFAVAHAFAVKAAQQGWRGPLNVQAKRADAAGTCWKVIELNGRFSGGTSCRLHLGFDEVAMIINEWVGRPVVGQLNTVPVRHIIRELTDYPVRDTDGYCQSRELGQINAE
jgi:hypothetical protein